MLRGIGVSDGIATGRAYVINEADLSYEEREIDDIDSEKKRFREALRSFAEKTEVMAVQAEKRLSAKDAEIIRGHEAMAQDPYMLSQIEERLDGGVCAEKACEDVLDDFAEMFMQTDDELMQQRASDVKDIKKRLLGILLGRETGHQESLPKGSILVAEELTPSMISEINTDMVAGILTETGSSTSHGAILARALDIPAVFSVRGLFSQVNQGDALILDGRDGVVIREPDEAEKEKYRLRRELQEGRKEIIRTYKGKVTMTADGEEKSVYCNIGNIDDALAAASGDGEGIGLFRTEFLFMKESSAPDEEKQLAAYKKAAELFDPGSVIIRTLDIGGDKNISYLGIEPEDNPFMGFRAVRYCLDNRQLFKTQLRAILRAGSSGDVKIMIPLVTNIDEIRRVRTMIKEAAAELAEEEKSFDRYIKVGCMIETPAASLISDILAEECDFFSIGTNDLTQYTMAADRGNGRVAYLNNVFEPAVLRSVQHVISCGHKAGIPVGMCGEAAADPLIIPLLLAFGLDEFSVSPPSVLRTRYNISRWTVDEAKELAKKAMRLKTACEIQQLLRKAAEHKETF